MARKSVYTKEMVLDAAMKVFKREGSDAVTAKNIAKELNCSVAPIYSVYMRLEDLKKDLSFEIEKQLLEEVPNSTQNTEDNNFNSLLSRMFDKLEIAEDDQEFSVKLKEFKKKLLNKEDKSNIFSQVSELMSLLYTSKKTKFSKSQILQIIAKHRKYITEYKNK